MNESRLVYSTETNNVCTVCGKQLRKCSCAKKAESLPQDSFVYLSREVKGRNGKAVTLIRGLSLSGEELKEFAKKIRKLCGSGGTVKQAVIEIQGDHRDKIEQYFNTEGIKVKRSGG